MAQQTAVEFMICILLQFVFFIPFYFIWIEAELNLLRKLIEIVKTKQ
jgi:hypothetical protein